MNRFMIALAACFALAGVAILHFESRHLQDAAALQLEDMARVMATRDQLAAQGYRGERIVRLPEDGGAWHLTVWYDDKTTSPASRQLAGMLAGTPRLAALVAQTHFHEHSAAKPDWVFTHRYAQQPRPGLLLQDAAGRHVFSAAGADLPTDGELLADRIADAVNLVGQCGPDGCPAPRPAPGPDAPQRGPTRPLIERRKPAEASDSEKGALVLAALAGAALLYFVLKKGK